MRKVVIAVGFVLLGISQIRAAAPDTLWTKMFGGNQADYTYSVEETSDNGYVIAGHGQRETYPHWDDIKLIKLNQDGSLAWMKTYGTDSTVAVIDGVKETSDGGLIVGGYLSGWYGDETANYFLMKLNAQGDSQWTGNYDFDLGTDYGADACQTLDGGYVMVGSSYYWSTSQGKYDWGPGIVKTDAYGNELHKILLDRSGTQHFNRVIPTSDSGAIAIGTAGCIYLAKIDKYGDTSWVKGYGGVGSGWGILQLADGGYMAFGCRSFGYPNYEDFWLVRLNSAGDSLWTRRYQNIEDNRAYSLDQTDDGGFVMAGAAYRNGGMDPTDFYIIRTDANCDTLWTMMMGREYRDYATCIKQTSDGGYIIAGWTDMGDGTTDIYIVKLGQDNASDLNPTNEVSPSSFNLGANYPNPFNPNTIIEYSLDRRAYVKIEIFDILGQKVRTLVEETKAAGSYRTEWNGNDDVGRSVSTGIYLYCLRAGDVVQAKKMLLIK